MSGLITPLLQRTRVLMDELIHAHAILVLLPLNMQQLQALNNYVQCTTNNVRRSVMEQPRQQKEKQKTSTFEIFIHFKGTS
jgi:hypothetical protein